MDINEEKLAGIAFIGNVLAPFYLEDPRTGSAADTFKAVAQLDVSAAAQDWPFVDEGAAAEQLGMMAAGLADSLTPAGEFEAAEEITWEYRRLFVGPQALPVPPFGSVYTDYECVIFGHTTAALREWNRKHGVARHADMDEPDDQVGFMLYEMSWLAQNQPQDVAEFLQLHFLPWAGHLLGELADATENPFYKGLALLTHASLDGIQTALELEVVEPEFYR